MTGPPVSGSPDGGSLEGGSRDRGGQGSVPAPLTAAVFHELLDELRALEDRLFLPDVPLDELSVLEGYKWIFSILAVGLDAHVWADPARPRFVDIVGPYRKWGGDNADAFYQYAPIDPDRTYVVTGAQGRRRLPVAHRVRRTRRTGATPSASSGTVNDRALDIADDGTFSVVLSPDPTTGPGSSSSPTRCAPSPATTWPTRSEGAGRSGTSKRVDPPATRREDDADLARRFRAARHLGARPGRASSPSRSASPNTVDEPYRVPSQTFGWAAGDAAYAMGSYELGEDEALVIEGRSPACAFWNVCLWNQFLHTYDYAYERVTLNGDQVVYEPDGSWRLVVAPRDPGHPNWISTAGHSRGRIWFRGSSPRPPRPGPRPGSSPVRPISPGSARERPPGARSSSTTSPHPRFTPEIDAAARRPGRRGARLPARARRPVRRGGRADRARRLRRRRLPRPPRRSCAAPCATEAGPEPAGRRQLVQPAAPAPQEPAAHPGPADAAIPRSTTSRSSGPSSSAGCPARARPISTTSSAPIPALRSLPYWESLEPVLAEAETPGPGEPDPRLGRTAFALDMLDQAMPYFKRMHEMTVDHVHEEIQLLAIDVSTMLFETQALMPSWRDHFRAEDQTPSYRVPAHRAEGPAVAAGRHPVGPQVTAAPRAVRPAGGDVPRRHLRRHPPRPGVGDRVDGHHDRLHRPAWPSSTSTRWPSAATGRRAVEDLFRACADDRDLLPADRSIDVRFHEFMADDIGHGRADLRRGRPALHRRRPRAPWRRSWPPTPAAATARRVPARGARHRPGRASPGPRRLHRTVRGAARGPPLLSGQPRRRPARYCSP